VVVGRAKEVARIDWLLGETRMTGGGALLLGGEPAIGKTALLSKARERAPAWW